MTLTKEQAEFAATVGNEIPLDEVCRLLAKLTRETEEDKLAWHMIPLEPIIVEQEKDRVALVNVFADYHAVTRLTDTLVFHLQYLKGRYYIWLDTETDIVRLNKDYYRDPRMIHQAIELTKQIHKYVNVRSALQIHEYINS